MRKLAIFFSLLLLMPAAAAAQDAGPGKAPGAGLPDTPAGRRAAAFLRVIGREDEESIRQFFAEHVAPGFRDSFPMEEHIKQFQAMRRSMAAPEPAGFEEAEPGRAQLTVRSGKSGNTYLVEFELERDAPRRIAGFGWRRADPKAAALRFDSLEGLDAALRKEAAENRFSGVVLIAEQGAPVFRKAYGLAEKGNRVPNRADTKFDVGSITKDFTASAVLQLAERGGLKLDDTLGKYLTGFPPEIADRVTIRHLLQHRSGWGEYWGSEEYRKSWRDLRSVGSYLDIIRKLPLHFEPGSREQYSNVGYVVLGAVVEKAGGLPYYDYVRKNIFEPLGMRDTDFYEADMPVENRAVGYTNLSPWGPPDGFRRANMYIEFPRGNPSGGTYSTADDLLKFFNGLVGDRVMSKASTDLMLNGFDAARQPPDRSKLKGGLAGGAPGVSAVIFFGGGRNVIVLSNYDEPVAEKVGRQVFNALPQLLKR